MRRDKENVKFKNKLLHALRENKIKSDENSPEYYPNGWSFILLSFDLTVNKVKPVIAFGQEMIAFRGRSGNVYVVNSFCAHLMANKGKVIDECIRCPIHDWTYRGNDGSFLCNNNDNDRGDKIKIWKTFELNGITYIWYHSREIDPYYYPDQIGDKFVVAFSRKHYTKGFFQDILENGLDAQHFMPVHRPILLNIHTAIGKMLAQFIYLDINSLSDINQNQPNTYTTIHVKPVIFGIKLKQNEFYMESSGLTCFLQRVSLLGFRFGLSVNVVPIHRNKVNINHCVYAELTIMSKLLAYVIGHFAHKFISEDILIWSNKMILNYPLYTKNDIKIKELKEWYRKFE